jgi:S1-C subfamily serine protease
MARLDAWVADRTGTLGVFGFNNDAEEEAERKALALPSGALVKNFVGDSAAERAGIRPRDAISPVSRTEARAPGRRRQGC